jgi:alpha-beta hydrolase superfamily lysophospholipase
VGEPVAVVLALHGFDDYSNAFTMPARLWAARGIATYAYDQRGFGQAPGRGRWAGGRRLAADAITALGLLHRRYPDTPVYLLGESMGAAVAVLVAAGRTGLAPPPLAGVILVSPAVWGRQTMSFFERAGLWLADLMPGVHWSARALPIRILPSTICRCCAPTAPILWSSSIPAPIR